MLTKSQAKAVRALHEAWKRGLSLDHQALLEAADRAPTSQFRDLFRTRPEAFKALIVHKGKGIYRLNLPFPKARTGR